MRNIANLNQYNRVRGHTSSHAHIWAIGGGKGGVGKSFVSSGLALFLANKGHKTVLVDLDLGGANLHSYLNIPAPTVSIQDVILDNSRPLNEVMLDTHLPNLKLISSHNDKVNLMNLNDSEKSRLMSALYKLEADYIILDLSAGTNETTLDLFNCAQKHIVVATPEPVSVENAYRFMKEAFYKKLRRLEQQFSLQRLIEEVMNRRDHYNVSSPADLLHTLKQLEPGAGQQLIELMNQYEYQIIINQTRSYKDKNLGHSMTSVCRKYFGINSECIGHLEYDNAVWQSLRDRKHLLMSNPHSRIYGQLLGVTKQLIEPSTKRRVA